MNIEYTKTLTPYIADLSTYTSSHNLIQEIQTETIETESVDTVQRDKTQIRTYSQVLIGDTLNRTSQLNESNTKRRPIDDKERE